MLVRYCDLEWGLLVLQICLTLVYVAIEVLGRFFTFKFYTRRLEFNDADYFCWSPQAKNWVQIE